MLITLLILSAAAVLILFNTKQNIVFFYTPTELIENNVALDKKVRIGGYVKNSSFIKNHKVISVIGNFKFIII